MESGERRALSVNPHWPSSFCSRAGGRDYELHSSYGLCARVIASTVGAAIALVGIWLVIVDMRGPVRGVRITFPSDREGVPEKITVRGEVSKAIPDGKELWLLRIYEKHDRFVPMGPAHIRSD